MLEVKSGVFLESRNEDTDASLTSTCFVHDLTMNCSLSLDFFNSFALPSDVFDYYVSYLKSFDKFRRLVPERSPGDIDLSFCDVDGIILTFKLRSKVKCCNVLIFYENGATYFLY